MRKAYFVITVLLLIAVVIQFYFAALGVFGPQGETDNLYLFHRINGSAVLPILSLLAVLFAIFSRLVPVMADVPLAPWPGRSSRWPPAS